MVLVVAFEVDIPEEKEFVPSKIQGSLVEIAELTSEPQLTLKHWFTTSEIAYDKMLEV